MNKATKKLIAARQEIVTDLLRDGDNDVAKREAAQFINKLCQELGASDIPTPINRVRNFIGTKINAVGNFVAASPSTNVPGSPSTPVDAGEQLSH